MVPLQDQSDKKRIERLVSEFCTRFKTSDSELFIVKAPLRICPLGAHIDHQLGVVTGMTIDQKVILIARASDDPCVRIESTTFPGRIEFSLDDIPSKVEKDWGNYPRGAVLGLQEMLRGRNQAPMKRGFMALVDSAMPIGGLSSSAAVTVSYLLAAETVNELEVSGMDNVELVRFTENRYIGLNNGILDQSVILLHKPGTLTRIDCSSCEVNHVETPESMPDFSVMVVYSGTSRQLVHTDYNARVSECREAARLLLEMAGKNSDESCRLRDIPDALFAEYGDRLSPVLQKRARHFFTEMARVKEGVSAWADGDMQHFGELVNQSGESSIVNYECGSPHMTDLVRILKESDGVYGARFSGAGFRGSCLAMIDPLKLRSIMQAVDENYPRKHPAYLDTYSIHICTPDAAACAGVLGLN